MQSESLGEKAPLRFGVIGLGYWGQNYLRLIRDHEAVELVAICDRSPELLYFSRGLAPGVAATRDPGALLDLDEVDAVVIATPATTHYPLVRSALETGKQVLCEKPLALTGREGRELADLSERTGCVLFVGHTFVYNAAIRALRDYIGDDDFGPALHAHAVWAAPGPVRQDVNALWDLAPHPISILSFVLGRQPELVSASGQAILDARREDVTFLHLRYDDDVSADIYLSWLAPRKTRTVTIAGSERIALFDDMKPADKLEIFDTTLATTTGATTPPARKLALPNEPVHVPQIAATEPLAAQLLHFVECCREGTTPDTDALAGTALVRILEAANQSLANRGAPVALDELDEVTALR